MPELVFKGKDYVYNHHLTVPYLSNGQLPEFGVEVAPLPFALYREA